MEKQSFDNKRGEIEFKQKLFKQQIDGVEVFDNEFNSAGIEEILLERMEKTKKQMDLLKSRNIILSPYIEIGAERGQRSLTMENDLNLSGAAVDLSYDMLLSCDYYGKKFKKEKLPLRICCDAYNLPFASESVPFIFCYETLHHFPDPLPVINEIFRVLSPGGYFFFDEEPCRGLLQLKLFKSKDKIYSKEAQNRGIVKQLFEYFLYKKSSNEIDHNIVENDNILLASWKKKFEMFEKKDIILTSSKSIFITDIFKPAHFLNLIPAHFFGGSMKGLCRKEGTYKGGISDIYKALRCPDCAQKNINSYLIKEENQSSYICPQCKNNFLIKNGVSTLFENKTFLKLYSHLLKNG